MPDPFGAIHRVAVGPIANSNLPGRSGVARRCAIAPAVRGRLRDKKACLAKGTAGLKSTGSDMDAEFIVARNPDPESRLPFLLRLPLDGGIWLKAKESWPRATRVYCHASDPPDLTALEVLERVVASACVRRGPAIDLVLARGTNKRSQFVFTSHRGRPIILWQTPKSASAARPGLRVPFTRAASAATFCIDTRERYGYTFSRHGAAVVRRALPVGDYAAEAEGRIIAAVERKSCDDFARSAVDGTLNYAMAELATLPAAAVVVEAMYSELLRHQYTRTGFIADVVARLQVRYPNVPIVFAESRKIGEEWTFRFLRAAHATADASMLAALPQAAAPEEAGSRKRRKPASAADTQAVRR